MIDEGVLESVTRRVYERIGDINYVKLKALIRRFLEYNPDGDVEKVDWASIYDDSLEFDELIEVFREAYPMYRWDRPREMSIQQYEDEKVGFILQNIEDLSEDAIRMLVKALEERLRAEGVEGAFEAVEAATPTTPAAETVQQVQPPSTTTVKPTVEAAPTPKVVVDLRMMAKYPWLSEVRGFASAYAFDEMPEKVIERAKERVEEALERGELGVIPKLDDPFTELLSFPTAKAIVSTIDDDWLKRRWSLAEASRVERLLLQEPQNVFDYLLQRLELQVQRCDEGVKPIQWTRVDYRIRVADYLRFAGDLLRELEWKLVNQPVHGGWVYLTRTKLTRVVRQYLYSSLYKTFETTPKLRRPTEALSMAITDIAGRLQEIRARRRPVKPTGRVPPCMSAIRERLVDATHGECFAYAAYLLNKGCAVEDVVREFMVRSDFKEDIARYQVEHIAGLRGSRIRYRPPSCQTMRQLGLCVENGELCPKNIRNPLEF